MKGKIKAVEICRFRYLRTRDGPETDFLLLKNDVPWPLGEGGMNLFMTALGRLGFSARVKRGDLGV